eukprot:15326477-Ditylum_brightwellii.AAC.1
MRDAMDAMKFVIPVCTPAESKGVLYNRISQVKDAAMKAEKILKATIWAVSRFGGIQPRGVNVYF